MSENLIRRFILSFSGILLFLSLSGQKNYLPGYILPLRGDTLHGFIDNRKLEKTSAVIYFSETADGEMKKNNPADIKGFGVNGEAYESAIIKTEKSSTEIDYNPGLELENDTTFLETIVKGPRCLYFYKNRSGKDQFYIKNDSAFELLVYKMYYKVYDNQSRIIENTRYIGQLSVYLNDCPAINSKLNKTKYNKDGLRKLFLSYYDLTGSAIQFQPVINKITLETGLIAGGSSTSVKMEGIFASPVRVTDYNKSVNFSGGIFLNIIFPKFQGKWSVYNELLFTSWNMSGIAGDYPTDKYSVFYSEIGYSYLKLNNMLRFKYPVGGLFIFLNAGLSNGYAICETNYLSTDRSYYGENTVREGKAMESTRKYEQGYLLGLGTKYKKFSLEIRNERTNGFSAYSTLLSKVNRYYLLLGYRF